ncbi:hypothetical protein Ciccas_009459 [Cichlidogyrus casuarinus]|uniref:Fork-head domain-containing protein n=1 Tax=Cichlidogyrus casuarinus TaxID=1844966 RepID=A0ABD2PWZ5_9PLAT
MNILAEKLRSNLAYKQGDLKEADDSLTNLNWLYDANPLRHSNGDQGASSVSSRVSNAPLKVSVDDLEAQAKQAFAGSLFDPLVRHEYRTKWTGKPPFPYATLICLAMKEMGKPKVTLSDIYGWIIGNFAYYRYTDSSWQNSVRHNLSLNKCFEKVPREKGERGKGGFWRVNPKYSDWMESNITKCRKVAPPPGPPPPVPRAMLIQLQSEQGRNINDPDFDASELIGRSLYMPVQIQQQQAFSVSESCSTFKQAPFYVQRPLLSRRKPMEMRQSGSEEEMDEDQLLDAALPRNYSRTLNTKTLNKRKRALAHIRIPFSGGPSNCNAEASQMQSTLLYASPQTMSRAPLRQSLRARRPVGTYFKMHEGVLSSSDEDQERRRRGSKSEIHSDELVEILNDLPSFDTLDGPSRASTSTPPSGVLGSEDDPIWPSITLTSLNQINCAEEEANLGFLPQIYSSHSEQF